MRQGHTETVQLPKVLDIAAAGPLVAELLRHRGKDLSVDAGQVERVGAQCIQVLLSAASTWQQDGVEFEIAEPSPVFTEGLETVGLELASFTARTA